MLGGLLATIVCNCMPNIQPLQSAAYADYGRNSRHDVSVHSQNLDWHVQGGFSIRVENTGIGNFDMRQFVSVACGLWIACAAPLAAEETVVVELYTSQGCSSCPPADEFVAMLAADPRIIALSLHVDYWDYIGWSDKFAQPKFTDRQRAYAKAIGSRTIYTPQLIIDGQDRIEGYAPVETSEQLRRHLSMDSPVDLVLERQGDVLVIRAIAEPPLDEPVRIQLVRFKPEETVTIERGENAGKTITYHNIVTSWESVGEWSGQEPLAMSAPAAGAEPAVVILQSMGPAEIVAAKRID